MKKLIFALIACALGSQVSTAAPQWLTSVPEAEAKAKTEQKLVLLDFTGSDWCVWCKKLDADVFAKPEFDRYASTNLVLVEVDFPAKKPQSDSLKTANAALQSKYKVEGFPTVVVLKPDGSLVWKNEGYLKGGPTAFIAEINKARQK